MTEVPAEKAAKPGLNIYGCAAVNPSKCTIMAEELGLANIFLYASGITASPYNYINLDMSKGEMGEEWFKTINPNGKVPAIVHVKEDGTKVTVWESAACLLYMADMFDKEHKFSYPVGTPGVLHAAVLGELYPANYMQIMRCLDLGYISTDDHGLQLSWQVAGYGPMMGQAAHFNRYIPKADPYGSWRYTSECRRLHAVLEKRLAETDYLVGDRMTIADFAAFIFAHSARWCGVDIDDFPKVKEWRDKIAQRPAVQKALLVPVPYQFSDTAVVDPANQDTLKMIRKFGTQGIKGATMRYTKEATTVPSDHANYEE
ncbi:MFS general substrate transporter [Apiospora arundinis]